jgi:hypothetical protein
LGNEMVERRIRDAHLTRMKTPRGVRPSCNDQGFGAAN